LLEAVKKLPSYKDQVKGNPKLNFKEENFSFSDKDTDYDVFLKLYNLISPIRDNHLVLQSNRALPLEKPSILEIPKATIDSAIKFANPNDSVAGTYYAGKYQLELVKINDEYIGVIENAGRYYTQFILREVTPNHFDRIWFADKGKSYFVYRNTVFINQRLSGTAWKKYQKADFVNLPDGSPRYDFKTLGNDIAYLKLGGFGTSNESIAESIKFHNQLPEIAAKTLIVDLRGNGGGGFKNSKKFLDLIKNFKGTVHVLINNNTVSNAEQFTIDLLKNSNVITYGESTRGTICYGNNVDTTIDLPSKRFAFYITDMQARKQDIPFESYGIQPKIKLNPFEKDWIQQVVDRINNK
ncbi:MAG: hypothetical protein EOO47_20880, partial [Flavobacterium sp.]